MSDKAYGMIGKQVYRVVLQSSRVWMKEGASDAAYMDEAEDRPQWVTEEVKDMYVV